MSDASWTLLSAPNLGVTAKASSVLQKSSKYSPMQALDASNASSCWYSDGGESQWIMLDFHRTVTPRRVRLQFQAGFSAANCQVLVRNGDDWEEVNNWDMEDVHKVQQEDLDEPKAGSVIKLVFDDFTDFYGRVTIYQLEIWGEEN